MANPWSGGLQDYRKGADQNIVQGHTGMAAMEGQGSVIREAGSMANMMKQMMTMWMQYKTDTFLEDKKAMSKYLPSEGEMFNVTKNLSPQTQAKAGEYIAQGRKDIFKAMQKNDKPKVAELMNKLNSVTDQFAMINKGLDNHKKAYEEGNYSAASDHFDYAQLSTGKYETLFDEESGKIMLAMFDRDKNRKMYTADQIGANVITKQRDVMDGMKGEISNKFREARELDDMDFPAEYFRSYADQITEKEEVVTSLAYDDLYRDGGENVMWALGENEAQARKNAGNMGMPHIPTNNSWADPFSADYDPQRLKTMVIGEDGDGEYAKGGLMEHFQSEWEKKSGAYIKKREVAENKKRMAENKTRAPKPRDMFTVNYGMGKENKVEMQRQTLDSHAASISARKAFAWPGKGLVKPVGGTLWEWEDHNGDIQSGPDYVLVNHLDTDSKGSPMGLLPTYPMFTKFKKPIVY